MAHRSVFSLASFAFATGFALVACSSTTDLKSASGDGGSTTEPGKDGGGTTNPDGGPSEEDGSTNPQPDGAAACDSAKSVCDDFDQGTGIHTKWTQSVNGGTATIVAGGLSAPNAFQVTVNAGAGAVYIEKELPFSTKVHCELDMKIEALPTQGDLDLFSITTKTPNDYYVYFAHSTAGFQFAEFAEQLPGGGSVDKKQAVTAPPTGSWFHVVFDNDGKSATLTVNGAATTLTDLAAPSGTSRNVQIGAPFSQDLNTASRTLYDNVLCTFGN